MVPNWTPMQSQPMATTRGRRRQAQLSRRWKRLQGRGTVTGMLIQASRTTPHPDSIVSMQQCGITGQAVTKAMTFQGRQAGHNEALNSGEYAQSVDLSWAVATSVGEVVASKHLLSLGVYPCSIHGSGLGGCANKMGLRCNQALLSDSMATES
ncbi:hypothetical protein ARMGADRAFT_1037834 [Armillaria gallica]|uniref:Uncharacterized protein n=1 Tax=Armillaria gallica TaxID=47427 RepID=A0A2H3CPX4_ARMGA|nr:hypothetical protein ARMGADRAFT_1037834 [Armillaria gallica]